jgi:hypothetical protein
MASLKVGIRPYALLVSENFHPEKAGLLNQPVILGEVLGIQFLVIVIPGR